LSPAKGRLNFAKEANEGPKLLDQLTPVGRLRIEDDDDDEHENDWGRKRGSNR
jgi:hypothetical protein